MVKLSLLLCSALCCLQIVHTKTRHRQRHGGRDADSSEFSEENESMEREFMRPPPPLRWPPSQPPFPPHHDRRRQSGMHIDVEMTGTKDFLFPDNQGDIKFPDVRQNNRNRGSPEQRRPMSQQLQQLGQRRNQRICERKYAEYVERVFPDEEDTIADANDTDFDGRDLAAPGQYPHMAAVGYETDGTSEIDYKCGGSLISENFVATAAHCTNFSGEAPTKVRIGDLNLRVEEKFLEPQTRKILKIHRHPNYNTNSYYNDIALLQLDSDVRFTEFVRPIRLWTRPVLPNATAFAMGYGSTAFGKARTDRLTDLNMTIVPNAECNTLMPAMPEVAKGIIESLICALDYAQNRDTCQGDSGGPLQLNLRGRRRRHRQHYHLIGITSYGLYCRSGYPSVYTRVSTYIDWIERIVWPLET